MNKENSIYTEVDPGWDGYEKTYINPLTKTFQYEYALYQVLSGLFKSVECSSKCIETLKLYFAELARGSSDPGSVLNDNTESGSSKRKTQEGLITEITHMVERDVQGHVNFPDMHNCRARMKVLRNKDGSHIFVFTDEVYSFAVRLNMPRKGRKKIEVANLDLKCAS